MKRELNHHYEYLTREKRIPLTSLCHFGIAEEVDNRCATDWQDELMVQLETELILHSLAKKLPSKEMRIIRMKLDGAAMHDIAKAERITFHDIKQLLAGTYDTVVCDYTARRRHYPHLKGRGDFGSHRCIRSF